MVTRRPLMPPISAPHRFVLVRDVDRSGISGTGAVAEGIQFTDGVCVMRWMTGHRSTCIYETIGELIAIHGHEGASHVDWLDR